LSSIESNDECVGYNDSDGFFSNDVLVVRQVFVDIRFAAFD
jgi:hypothetical protein